MRIAKENVDVQLQIPDAVIRMTMDFGDMNGYDKMCAEYFTLAEGVDTAPLTEGLEGNHCHAPHWGFVLDGEITMTDSNGTKEKVNKHDLFYWPPGHNIRVDSDAEIIMFSPQQEHSHVVNHIKKAVESATA